MLTNNNHTTNYSLPLFEVFFLSIIIVWLPLKSLAYLVPFIGIIWFIIRTNSGKSFFRLFFFVISYILIIGAYFIFYKIIETQFITQNAILFFLTYGSFWFFLILPSNKSYNKTSYLKYLKVIKVFILLESFLGMTQLGLFILLTGDNFDSSTGDTVQGTLNILSFLNPGDNFNNQIYTNNLLLLLLFYTPYAIFQRKDIWICIIGFLMVSFASVWHLFIAFLFAVVIITFIFSRSFIKISLYRLLASIILASIIFISIMSQPKNFSLISYYYQKIISYQSLKSIVTLKSVTELPDEFPWVYIIGLGPGQYSSRAGLIGTGKYFGKFDKPMKIPFLENNYSNAFNKYIYPEWKEYSTNSKYGNSTISRPFYSILSVLTELGYVIFIILILFVFLFIRKIRKIYLISLAEKKILQAFYSLSCAICVIYLVLIAFFENYLEVTQAIFPGLILLKYFYLYTKGNYNISSN